MTTRVQFEVLKAGARWRAGQTVECELGVALDAEGPGALHAVKGIVGATALRARLLPGAVDVWNARARKLAVLGHPNVVPVLGVGAREGNAFLIEERPDGEPLRRWAQKVRAARGAVALEEVAKLAVPIAGALRHAHDAGLVHGGLDAGCVNVARDPVGDFDVRVSAFGLVSSLRELREELSPETWITLAPEAIVDGAKLEATADLFSLGVLVLEVLTGSASPLGTRRPWREIAGTGAKELRKVLGEQREDVPDALWEFIAGLLAAEPKQRAPASARDLMRALQKLSWEPKVVVKHEPRRARADEAPTATPRVSEPVEAARASVPKIVSVTSLPVEGSGAPARAGVVVTEAADLGAQTLLDYDEPVMTGESPVGTAAPSAPERATSGAASARDVTLVDDDGPGDTAEMSAAITTRKSLGVRGDGKRASSPEEKAAGGAEMGAGDWATAHASERAASARKSGAATVEYDGDVSPLWERGGATAGKGVGREHPATIPVGRVFAKSGGVDDGGATVPIGASVAEEGAAKSKRGVRPEAIEAMTVPIGMTVGEVRAKGSAGGPRSTTDATKGAVNVATTFPVGVMVVGASGAAQSRGDARGRGGTSELGAGGGEGEDERGVVEREVAWWKVLVGVMVVCAALGLLAARVIR